MAADGGDREAVLAEFARARIQVAALADRPREDGATAFVKSWNDLMAVIASKSAALGRAG